MTNWGPTGQLVYERTYSRTKPNGGKETWNETVDRVVNGNLGLVDSGRHLENEERDLKGMIEEFKIIPAGRHLWASGVRGRQYLFNCHVSGWGGNPWDHFEFTFMRLMEGGGVGANYSQRFLRDYPLIVNNPRVHIVCDPEHPDYEELRDNLSDEFTHEWAGSFEIEDSREGWADALVQILQDHYQETTHPDRVFDVSRIRRKGARLKTFGGTASGPAPLARMLHEVTGILGNRWPYGLTGLDAMQIDHSIARCVVSGGNRRSARMGIMHWNDPYIYEFIGSKKSGGNWSTNISVEVDRAFWQAIRSGEEHANSVLASIASGMLTNGEPGFWDSNYSNLAEPHEVIATNPCGEIALESWENCNLGHINLDAFVDDQGRVSWIELHYAHSLMTRFLMRATYGDVTDSKQAAVLGRNRRIGVGHLGLASFAAKIGVRYADIPSNAYIRDGLRSLADTVDHEAQQFAHDLRIPVPVKKRTVAPTGTIAKLPGVSEGIHPIFSKYFIRRVRFAEFDPDQRETLVQYAGQGYKVEADQSAPNTSIVEIPTMDNLVAEVAEIYGSEQAEVLVQATNDLTLREMLQVQAMYQTDWADNAVSYTANLNPDLYTTSEVAEILSDFGGVLKGATIFPNRGYVQAPYEEITREQYWQYRNGTIADGVDENCVSGACPVK